MVLILKWNFNLVMKSYSIISSSAKISWKSKVLTSSPSGQLLISSLWLLLRDILRVAGIHTWRWSWSVFCMDLLKVYYKNRNMGNHVNNEQINHYFLLTVFKHSESVAYLGLNLPEFSLFAAVHLTVYHQNIWETSNVACLHLQCNTKKWLPCTTGNNQP